MKRAVKTVWPPVLLAAALIGGWQLYVTSAGVDPTTLPSPQRVVEQGWKFRDILWDQTVPTLQETAAGFGLSFVFAWVTATLLDFSETARRALYPLLVASQTIPIVVIAPLMIIWFGFGLLPKMLIVALVTFFALTTSLAAGFASADGEAMRLLKSMGAGRWRSFLLVRVPSAMPFFFTGLRVSITYAVSGAVFAEYAGAEKGLGIFIQAQKSAFRTDLVLAAVGIVALLSIALFAATYALERLVLPYRKDKK